MLIYCRPAEKHGFESTMDTGNIVLTGFMGTGKSTVGKMLARRLGYTFVDTDHIIESRAGLSVARIFETLGEPAFREMETELARELGAKQKQVIATGGGMLVNPINRELLEQSGRVFCLTADLDSIIKRLSSPRARTQRPLLKAVDLKEHVTKMLAQRAETYRQFTQIDTSGKSAKQAVQLLLDALHIEKGA
jgi:shikimate kinase